MTMNGLFQDVRIGGAFDPDRIGRSTGCVVVGSSASGKSTLIRGLRRCGLAADGLIEFPRRLITRSQRLNDDLEENEPLTDAEMQRAIARQELEVWWNRDLERTETYAFRKAEGDAFAVYSTNNALLRSNAPQVVKFLSTMAVIQIYAPDQLRTERLLARSPDMFAARPNEVSLRLKDSSDSIVPLVDFVIRTDGEYEAGAPASIEQLVLNLALCPSAYLTNL